MKTVYKRAGILETPDKPAIIFDLDGTLSNDSMRVHHLNAARLAMAKHLNNDPLPSEDSATWSMVAEVQFSQYHEIANLDKPNPCILGIAKAFLESEDCEVWILTSRPMRYASETLLWVHKAFTGKDCLEFYPRDIPHRIIMRQESDNRPSWLIKREYLSSKIKNTAMLSDSVLFDNDDRITEALRPKMQTLLFTQQDQL